ncbi:MAG: hypothetical protein NC124_13505 [Clostridium sp.]|nr:hypothetical protein [Clostridium sp.]
METQYYVQKTSWWIYIKIVADAIDYYDVKDNDKENIMHIGKGLWIKYSDIPLIKGELFSEDDLLYLIKGIDMVKEQIRMNSKFKETVIVIKSLQYSPCDFQEEGLIAAMLQWSAQYFQFDCPKFKVDFDKLNNRYVFELEENG